MSGDDGQGAVDLFGKDHASELVRECDAAQRKKQVCALTGSGRPAIRRTDSKNETLSTAIAQPAKLLSEFFGGEQLASAVEQNGMSRSAARLTVEPLKQGRLGLKELRVARDVTGRPLDVVREQTVGRIGLCTTAARHYRGEGDFHAIWGVIWS
jgi:hypothetical protein